MKADAQLIISLAARPGVFGFTVHNAGYAALGLNYLYKPMTCKNLPDALAGARSLGIRGVGLTMPYKIAALPLLDELSPRAAAAGAVNTVVNNNGKLTGHNTDVVGAAELLQSHTALPWLVLGAGGMARAFLQAARELRHDKIFLSARDETKGRATAENFAAQFVPWEVRDTLENIAVLNATPIGMAPDEGGNPMQDLHNVQLVFDAVPKPQETTLVQSARAAAIPVITGRDLALAQAFAQFELYTGHAAPRDAMIAAAAQVP